MSVVPLALADAACGGKASGLAVLLRAGLDVPAGFVVTDPATGPRVVGEHLDRLRGRAVAVRSSGMAEDSVTASFAGQLATVLGARGLDEVMAAIRHCAASAHTDRARGYRAHVGLGEGGGGRGEGSGGRGEGSGGRGEGSGDEPAAPVIVQELVEAEQAGVLFTRDPRTGADAVVINASWGLGESVVSGAVIPDEIVVSAGAVRVTVGTKQSRLDLGEPGLVRSPVGETQRARCCLAPGEVTRLAALGRRCEDVFGRPQDVEWAVRDGRIRLLQSRPITVLGAPATPAGGRAARLLVTGVPSSPGRAGGPARLVRSPGDFARVRRGDVLVCRTTDPAWTPLFRLAAAVVTETGGVLSHAAIVAREFGLPAVAGAAEAMTSLTDGAPVTVDGTAGTVLGGRD